MLRIARPALLVLALSAALVPPAWGATGRFSLPARPPAATVWAVGDGAIGSDDARAVAAMAIAERPQAFLYLGDVYDYGTASDFRDHYATVYGPLKAVTLPTPGNHEWGNRRVGYNPYWAPRTGGRTPPPYYAVTLAGWTLLSLNSETAHAPGSAQVAWLRAQVRRPGTCRLAFWHRPRFSAGLHGDQPDMAPLWNALRGRAALVLNGHDHDMQWLRRRAGITELVAGAGGRGRYPIDDGDPRLVWGDDSVYGALRLTLRPGRADFAFTATSGRVVRSGSVACRPAA